MTLSEIKQRLDAADSIRSAAVPLTVQDTVISSEEGKGSRHIVRCICGRVWDRWDPRRESHELGCPVEALRLIAEELESPVRKILRTVEEVRAAEAMEPEVEG